jgi:sugar phosphate isomerase/epimerase
VLIGGRAHSLEDISAIGDLELSFAEISLVDPEQVEKDFRQLVSLKNNYQFFYLAHGPEEGNPWDTLLLKDQLLPRIVSLMDWAQRLEISLFTIHFWLDARFVMQETIIEKVDLLREMVEYASLRGIMLSIENLSETSKDFSIPFERIPDLGLTLDIGHGELLTRRNTAYGFIQDYPQRIKHVHVHDNRGGNSPGDDLHLPIGEGIIDYSSILSKLLEIGFDHTITLEIKPSDMLKGKREIEKRMLKCTW